MTPKMKTIPTFPKYAATRDGRIFRIEPCQGMQVPRELSQVMDSRGRPKVSTRIEGRRTARPTFVSHLVAEAFLGPREGRHVLHKNGIPGDNRVGNLRYKPVAP